MPLRRPTHKPLAGRRQVHIPEGQQRKTTAQRGYGAAWQRARDGYLAKHPLCVCAECKRLARIRPANVVDHIVPHKGDRGLFWDSENWMAMAKACHDHKTATRDGGFGRSIVSDGEQ